MYTLAQLQPGLSKLEIFINTFCPLHSVPPLQQTSIYCANIASSRGFPIIKFLHFTTLIITYHWMSGCWLYQPYCTKCIAFSTGWLPPKGRTPLLALLYFYRATPAPLPIFHSLDICSFCNGLIINWHSTYLVHQKVQPNSSPSVVVAK